MPLTVGQNIWMQIKLPPHPVLGPMPMGGEDEARGAGRPILMTKVGKLPKEKVVANGSGAALLFKCPQRKICFRKYLRHSQTLLWTKSSDFLGQKFQRF
jgi:hypothetical protein